MEQGEWSVDELWWCIDHVDGEEVVVALGGELDAARAGDARSFLRAVLEWGPASLVVDVRHLTFVDAAGLGVFVATSRGARERGTHFSLRDPRPAVMRVLVQSGLDQVLCARPLARHS